VDRTGISQSGRADLGPLIPCQFSVVAEFRPDRIAGEAVALGRIRINVIESQSTKILDLAAEDVNP
jgi:hypothetical protein